MKIAIVGFVLMCLAVNPAGAGNRQAVFHTSEGDFTCELLEESAPVTVENFVGLAKGTQRYIDPKTHTDVRKPLYNNTTFHRTIPGFMIQGGDVLGNSRGTPGYTFPDEHSTETFDGPGVLAMANSGPNTNGCQFFVTVKAQPHLNGTATIFGRVVQGLEVVRKISELPSEPGTGRARQSVTLVRVEIVEPRPSGSTNTSRDVGRSLVTGSHKTAY